MKTLSCSICGNDEFQARAVLWPELIAEWQLSADEVRYVDRQQGCSCTGCGANLRIVALAKAIVALSGVDSPLREALAKGIFCDWRILDCNGAGPISDALAGLPNYKRADFPEYDMCRMPFDDGNFDLIIHSDTLEHVEHPLVALEECRRLLSTTGYLCFTIPIIVGRRTRSREGLPSSYHGDPSTDRADYLVRTEFGADAWTMIFEAGFADLKLTQIDYPSAIAITASNGAPEAIDKSVHDSVSQAAAEPVANIYDQDGLRSIHNHESRLHMLVEFKRQDVIITGIGACTSGYGPPRPPQSLLAILQSSV
jgi:SAM-dependent methyltransferase